MTNGELPERRVEQEQRQERRALEEENAESGTPSPPNFLLFVGGIVLFALVLGVVLHLYIQPEPGNTTQRKDLVQAMALIIAGAAGAGGIFFTWRNLQQSQVSLKLTREAQEQNQKDTQTQLDLTRQGQMTERFTQAIEQLGSEKLEIRLGGIYSLERTAKEEKNYHWPIMEVLTSYVRRHAAQNPEKKSRENAAYPEPDIQAILAVIGRRSEYHRIDKEVEYGNIELNDTDLQGADLEAANLQRARLRRANLQRADLEGADLEGARLRGVDLHDADLEGANLQKANLHDADLHNADLRGANLQDASLGRANLRGARLEGANLQGVKFLRAMNLTQNQIEWTMGSNETQLPTDINRPELWSKSIEEQYNMIQKHTFDAD